RSAIERLLELRSQSEDLRQRLEAARESHHNAARALDASRDAVQAAQRQFQEASFNERVVAQKISDIEDNSKRLFEQQERARAALDQLKGELARLDEAPIQAELDRALALRIERERAL